MSVVRLETRQKETIYPERSVISLTGATNENSNPEEGETAAAGGNVKSVALKLGTIFHNNKESLPICVTALWRFPEQIHP